MAGRWRRRASSTEAASDEGPFVSFTDLVIGILFLFLILVAALILMNQEAVRRMSEQIKELQVELDAAKKLEVDHPPYRLGIVFNIYQRTTVNQEWTYSRTVQIYRAPNDTCITSVLIRSNLSTAWRPPTNEEDIPTTKDRDFIRTSIPCGISGSRDHWDTTAETGNLRRVSPALYEGMAILHKATGDSRVMMQYRVLGVFDDYFR